MPSIKNRRRNWDAERKKSFWAFLTHQSTPSVTAKGGPGTQGNNLLNLNSLPTVLNWITKYQGTILVLLFTSYIIISNVPIQKLNKDDFHSACYNIIA